MNYIKQALRNWLLKDINIKKLVQEEVIKTLNDISSNTFYKSEVKITESSRELVDTKSKFAEIFEFMNDVDVAVSSISLRISVKNKFKDSTYELCIKDIINEDIINTINLKPNDKIDGVYLWVNYLYEKQKESKCFIIPHNNRTVIEITIKETRLLLSKFPELLI